jgi:tRNA pseudouridine38-40 synthase
VQLCWERIDEPLVRNIKLVIEYDGSNYHGWQSQINASAVQDVIEDAIKRLTGDECAITGSSRTDAGVHAYGQVANFYTGSSIPAEKFSYALNSLLPKDIVVKEALEVSSDFHSRYSAKGKKYRYLIHNSLFPSALLRNRAFHVAHTLDIDEMRKAASCFKGTHDFTSFKAAGSNVKSPVRTITDISLEIQENIIVFEISGDGFLYNMVRIIAGTLVEVGIGKVKHDSIPAIIESYDRKKAGKTAPPQGLYLVEVYY